MNRRSLRDLLDLEGVGRSAYRLDGTSGEDALSLGPVEGGWRVWFTERGRETTSAVLETEDEACAYLAERLLADDGNRWVLVAGPSDPAEADRELIGWLANLGVNRADLHASDLRTEDLPWTSTTTKRRHWMLRTTTRRLPEIVLSDDLARCIAPMWEYRMGVYRIDLRLKDGSEIPDVYVVGRRVSWVAGYDTIPFRSDDIIGVREYTEK